MIGGAVEISPKFHSLHIGRELEFNMFYVIYLGYPLDPEFANASPLLIYVLSSPPPEPVPGRYVVNEHFALFMEFFTSYEAL